MSSPEWTFDEYAPGDIASSDEDDYYGSPEGGFSPGEGGGSPLEFGMGAGDYERVRSGEPEAAIGRKGEYVDPKDRARSEFKRSFRGCSDNKDKLQNAVDSIELLSDNLLNLNMPLLALGACFHSMYSRRGGINKTNVTQFIKDYTSNVDPIDVIRYIHLYDSVRK